MPPLTPIVVALPVLSALLTCLAAPRAGRRAARVAIAVAAATFALATVELWSLLAAPGPGGGAVLYRDPLGALMSWVIAGISLIVHLYARRYMAEEPGYIRFYLLLGLITAALLAMVTASDLRLLLVAWHLVGVLLYLLLGLDLHSLPAQRSALRSFFTHRLGDLPMVLAAGLMVQACGTWSLPRIFEALAAGAGGATAFGLPLATAVALLVALAAFARSAQILTHTWLPYTMDGPTPVSALMHAGIVNAGGFLVNRFAPVFVEAGGVLHLVFGVGLLTAILGSVLMLAQHDVKKALGYSTMGQMGFMIMECGLGAFSLAVYHLIAHGVFKGTLFLGSGGAIHAARADDGVPQEDIYSFVVARRLARQRRPWLLMAAFTLAVPAVILALAHSLVEQSFFERQGAVVLLFFGWMTGAQLIFSTYRMRSENPLRLYTLILVSFVVVVMGYTLIAHAFDLFLYPDPAFRARIAEAAGVRLVYFDLFAALLAGVIVLGWLFTYYAERRRFGARAWYGALRRRFYRAVSQELHLPAFYGAAARGVLAGAERVNAALGAR